MLTRREIDRFWSSCEKTSGGCWLWVKSTNRGGYGQVNAGGQLWLAHRLAYFLHIGEEPRKLKRFRDSKGELSGRSVLVCHRCDNRRCINPAHLFLGSYLDNNTDMANKGRGRQFRGDPGAFYGEKNAGAKLKTSDIPEIFRMRQRGDTVSAIARKFSVSRPTIDSVLHGETWRHIQSALCRPPADKP